MAVMKLVFVKQAKEMFQKKIEQNATSPCRSCMAKHFLFW
jgi:hypothetical protein